MIIKTDSRVDKELKFLSTKDKLKIGDVVQVFEEYGFALTELYLKKLGHNLWELRTGRWRLLFGMVGKDAIIVNIFLKKTQNTPTEEIQVAAGRLKEYLTYEKTKS